MTKPLLQTGWASRPIIRTAIIVERNNNIAHYSEILTGFFSFARRNGTLAWFERHGVNGVLHLAHEVQSEESLPEPLKVSIEYFAKHVKTFRVSASAPDETLTNHICDYIDEVLRALFP